jgi:hypothetical protein
VGRRFIALPLAALVAVSGLAIFSGAALAGSDPDPSSSDEEKIGRRFATLEIIEPNASVRRKGDEDFEPAKDGQRLRVGDTVKTDETGFVSIRYTADNETFTRLDSNTEFTIVNLTDEEGNRQVEGSLDVGRTWHRTTALTESETFSSEGAGATAVVEGTAYVQACFGKHICVWVAVVDELKIHGNNQIQSLLPLHKCGAKQEDETSEPDLCDTPDVVPPEELSDPFVAENIWIDFLGGFPGPDIPRPPGPPSGQGSGAGPGTSVGPSSNPPSTNPPPPTTSPVTYSIQLQIASASLPADGVSSTPARIRIFDSNGVGVSGLTIVMSSNPNGHLVFSGITDHGNGEYTLTIRSTTNPGGKTVTATVGSLGLSITKHLNLRR